MLEKFFRVCVRVKFLIGEKEREREKNAGKINEEFLAWKS